MATQYIYIKLYSFSYCTTLQELKIEKTKTSKVAHELQFYRMMWQYARSVL